MVTNRKHYKKYFDYGSCEIQVMISFVSTQSLSEVVVLTVISCEVSEILWISVLSKRC